jgi:hypothetical protein
VRTVPSALFAGTADSGVVPAVMVDNPHGDSVAALARDVVAGQHMLQCGVLGVGSVEGGLLRHYLAAASLAARVVVEGSCPALAHSVAAVVTSTVGAGPPATLYRTGSLVV